MRRMPWNRLSRANRDFRVAGDQPRVAGIDSAKAVERGNQRGRAEDDDYDTPRRVAEGARRNHDARRDREGVVRRWIGMTAFRYQAIEGNGVSVRGVVEAEDRKAALTILADRGLFPSSLESAAGNGSPAPTAVVVPGRAMVTEAKRAEFRLGTGIKRKEITAFTREMAALLGAGIPIPQALDGLGHEEENPALKAVVLQLADSVRKGSAVSSALEEHPRLFNKLY